MTLLNRLSQFLVLSVFSVASVASSLCDRANVYIGEQPFICTYRQVLSHALSKEGYEWQKSIGYKDVYRVEDVFPINATLVTLFNDQDELLMAQYIFEANTSDNAYKQIRMKLDHDYGQYKRAKGYELSPSFEFVWYSKDGVRIRFYRKNGNSRARLTFNQPHKTKAFLNQKGAHS